MIKINKAIALLLVASISTVFAGCGASTASNNQATEQTVSESSEIKKIRIGSPTADATALVENAGFALSLGYIDEELKAVGYEAEYVGFGQGGTAINEALASDQVDAAFVGDVPSIIGRSNGLDIEVVANLNNASGMGIIVSNDSDITSPQELKGKKIVTAFGTVTYIYLIRLLEQYGLTVNDVEIINDIANAGPLLAAGDADAAVSTRSGLFSYQSAGVGKILVTSNEDTDTKTSSQFYFYANKKYVDENEDAIKAIIRALIRSEETANTDPDATYTALANDEKDAATWEAIYPREEGFDFFEPYITEADKEYYDSTVKYLLDMEIISNEIHAADFFTNKYTEEVYKELGKEIVE